MCEEGEKDMLAIEPIKDKIQNFEIDSERIKELASKKEPIIVKNGVAQIDSSHPDYSFWMED